MSRGWAARVALLLGPAALLVLGTAAPALAHPLGNFTVNHYNGIELYPDRVDLLAIVDSAEIPSAQELPDIDTDDSGTPSPAEFADYAAARCDDLAAGISAEVDGTPLRWTVTSASMESMPGVAGLPTLRLTCPLTAEASLSGDATFTLVDDYRSGPVGWHEITATGDGVRLLDPPVAGQSISDELRSYPGDLLSSPLDQRSVVLRTEPGEGVSGGPTELRTGASGDPFTSFIASADRYLEELIGPELTPLVGVLAVLLAVLLGAGHALLPGHGKTVMAAYLAGRRGSRRDALLVGATVTGPHTAGVLILGLAISLSSAVAGEQVLRWLGVTSGLLIAGIGVALLRSALRSRRPAVPVDVPEPALVGARGSAVTAPAHDHPADHDHPHPHPHDHPHDHDQTHDHDHPHDHDHSEPAPAADGAHTHSHGWGGAHSHGGTAHSHGYSRGGLIGMGIAGGLVPSPSALIVLLASIGLGRTVFGVVLVFAYGLGMAGTLTAVGLLLVRLRSRLATMAEASSLRRGAARVALLLPVLTAILVLVVGLTLALRGVLSPV